MQFHCALLCNTNHLCTEMADGITLKKQNPPSKLSSLVNLYRKFCTSQALGGHQNPLRRERRSFSLIATDNGGYTLNSPPTYAFWLHSSFNDEPEARRVRMVGLSIRMLEAGVHMLEREGDRLRDDIYRMELKVGQGFLSSAITKVVRMKYNLTADDETRQIIGDLQNELLMRHEQVQAVEQLMKDLSDAGPGTHVDVAIAMLIMKLEDQIVELENREETYRAVFEETISYIRRAYFELFGYEIAMQDHVSSDGIPVSRFVLHSVYSKWEDDILQFEYDFGKLHILENDYTSQPEISQEVEYFIREMNAIPAFTACITMKLFSPTTHTS